MTETVRNSASPSLVLIEHRDDVATLTLNRPQKLNALNGSLGRALVEALNHVAHDPMVRAVVLTGAGRGFCAGGDLNVLRDAQERGDESELEEVLRRGKQIVLALAGMPKPVLAAVNGPAAGAGCNLALACDLRIASDRASFTQSFAKIGLFPDMGATHLLPRLVGFGRAAEMLYMAETISAAEAFRMGIVSRVVQHDSLDEETAAIASRLAAAPALVVRGIKQLLLSEHRATLERALDEEIRWQLKCFRSEDCWEGLAAYFEKRRPGFRGK
jgi:2-(1,2-epoxy-1,2-dihydrophenyl)acetyl-CoA isomerase